MTPALFSDPDVAHVGAWLLDNTTRSKRITQLESLCAFIQLSPTASGLEKIPHPVNWVTGLEQDRSRVRDRVRPEAAHLDKVKLIKQPVGRLELFLGGLLLSQLTELPCQCR